MVSPSPRVLGKGLTVDSTFLVSPGGRRKEHEGVGVTGTGADKDVECLQYTCILASHSPDLYCPGSNNPFRATGLSLLACSPLTPATRGRMNHESIFTL
jgi:hypothetical protein